MAVVVNARRRLVARVVVHMMKELVNGLGCWGLVWVSPLLFLF